MIDVETERLRLCPWRAEDYGPFAAYYADPANTPSIKLAQRLGAVHDGTIELATFGPHRVYRHY